MQRKGACASRACYARRITLSGPRELTGIARGVDAEGHLLLETDAVVIRVGPGTARLV